MDGINETRSAPGTVTKEEEGARSTTVELFEELWSNSGLTPGEDRFSHGLYEKYLEDRSQGNNSLGVRVIGGVRWRFDMMRDYLGTGKFVKGVYSAKDEKMGGMSAIKVYDSENAKYAFREAKILGGLQHPNIASVVDLLIGQKVKLAPREEESVGEKVIAGRVVLVMERCQKLLKDKIENDGIENIEEVREIIRGVASALDYLHGKGVYHGDIKSANVMIGMDGKAKVVDFGGAIGIGEEVKRSHSTPLWRSRNVDLARGDKSEGVGLKARPEDDWYSVGVLLYVMVTGGKSPPRHHGKGDVDIELQREDLAENLKTSVSDEDVKKINIVIERLLNSSNGEGYEDGVRLTGIVSGI